MKQVESILKSFNKVVAKLEKVCTQNKYQADKNLLDIKTLQEHNASLLDEAEYAEKVQEKIKQLLGN